MNDDSCTESVLIDQCHDRKLTYVYYIYIIRYTVDVTGLY